MRKSKLISVLVILSIVLCLSACGKRETPETAMDTVMQAILNQDDTTIEAYFDTDTKAVLYNDSEQTSEEKKDVDDFINLALKHLDYKIVTTEKEGDTAVVTIEITNADLGAIFTTVMQKAFSELLSSAFLPEDQRPSDEEVGNMYIQWFSDELNSENLAKVTKTVEVKMHYEEDHWKIERSDDFSDALLGGILSVAKKFSADSNAQETP